MRDSWKNCADQVIMVKVHGAPSAYVATSIGMRQRDGEQFGATVGTY